MSESGISKEPSVLAKPRSMEVDRMPYGGARGQTGVRTSSTQWGYRSHTSGEHQGVGHMAGPSFRNFSLVVALIFPIML